MHYTGAIAILCLFLLAKLNAVKIIRFYRDTCPYCVKSKGEWLKFKCYNAWNPFITSVSVDTDTELGSRIMRQYGIKSVPTIIKMKGLHLSKYEGDRTWRDITSFAYN
jgi:glutaredoxin